MLKLTSKTISVISGVTGIVAGSAGLIYLNSKNSSESKSKVNFDNPIQKAIEEGTKISQKLTEFGYLLLKTDDTEANGVWENMLAEYTKIKTNEAILKEITEKNSLKNECKSVLSSSSTETVDYSFAKRFCVKAETIAEMLKRNKYNKLETNVSDSNRPNWQSKIDLIKQNAQAQKDMELTLNDGTNNIDLLVAACKKLESNNSKTYEDKTFQENYIKAKDWCYLKSDT